MNYQCPVNSSLRNASIFMKYPKHQNVRSPPEHFAIGYVHSDNLPRGNIALQYIIQNNCRNVWWCFLMISCTFWRIFFFLNSPKLSCGFKIIDSLMEPIQKSKQIQSVLHVSNCVASFRGKYLSLPYIMVFSYEQNDVKFSDINEYQCGWFFFLVSVIHSLSKRSW